MYLSYDGGDNYGYYLVDNFKDLLNNWLKVGVVLEWELFFIEGKGIDFECENVKLLRKYIFSKIWKRGNMLKINNDWKEILEEEFEKEYFIKLKEIFEEEYKNYIVYFLKRDILNVFFFIFYLEVKVVFLG